MSHTDKTEPYAVLLMREGEVFHNHQYGECDLDKFNPRKPWMTCCGYQLPERYSYITSVKRYWGNPKRTRIIEKDLEHRSRRKWKHIIDDGDPDDEFYEREDSAYLVW